MWWFRLKFARFARRSWFAYIACPHINNHASYVGRDYGKRRGGALIGNVQDK
jgi:hypothetical protein